MKIRPICFIIILTCSCCSTTDDIYPERSSKTMARHDEIRRIMRNHWIQARVTNDFYYWLSHVDRKRYLNELHKMKEDYYYELSDQNINLTIPGPGWGIRGPLTIAQVEQESLEKMKQSPRNDVPQIPFGFQNDVWIKLRNQYKEGDEFYWFASDKHSWAYLRGVVGYILIRKNKVIGMKVTNIS